MSNQIENAKLEWRDGELPIAVAFDDPYFSIANGLEETRYVFLSGNDLPNRFVEGFHIAELGFGTGLNLLATWQSWLAAGMTTQLHFTSFEAYPMRLEDMRRSLSSWPELAELSEVMLTHLQDGFAIETPTLKAQIIIGDARTTLPKTTLMADAWFLDGFSPAKNPELWGKRLLLNVGQHTNQGGTFATYTAAGFVRNALQEAGFEVERTKGFGRKRHMSLGKRL